MRKCLFLCLFLLYGLLLYAQRQDPSALKYIEKYKHLAIEEMRLTGIPASITLAQALHESANGTSQIAINANNHFGVKCTANWRGKKYYRNNNKRNNCFRNYETVEDAYKDRSRFLSTNKKYASLFQYKPTQYKKWAHGLQRSGYAASRSYTSHLLRTIKVYDLHQYDLLFEDEYIDANDSTVISIDQNKEVEDLQEEKKKTKNSFISYKVKKGDSLYVIARKHSVSVKAIKKKNNLKSNLIKPGQRIIIPQ